MQPKQKKNSCCTCFAFLFSVHVIISLYNKCITSLTSMINEAALPSLSNLNDIAYIYTGLTSTALHPPKVWERFPNGLYSILKRTHLENFFHNINNLYQNIKPAVEEQSNGKLVNQIMERSLYRYIGNLLILTIPKILHYSSHHQTNCKESVVFSLFLPFLLSPTKMT